MYVNVCQWAVTAVCIGPPSAVILPVVCHLHPVLQWPWACELVFWAVLLHMLCTFAQAVLPEAYQHVLCVADARPECAWCAQCSCVPTARHLLAHADSMRDLAGSLQTLHVCAAVNAFDCSAGHRVQPSRMRFDRGQVLAAVLAHWYVVKQWL